MAAPVKCNECGKIVERHEARQKFVGYRRTGVQGTLTSVRLLRSLDEWICDACVRDRAHGAQTQTLDI